MIDDDVWIHFHPHHEVPMQSEGQKNWNLHRQDVMDMSENSTISGDDMDEGIVEEDK